MSTQSTLHTPAPVATAPTPAPTKLAPWPATRLSDGPDPYALPEGEEPPKVMVTQDIAGTRTISTMYDPADQLPPVPPPVVPPGETPVTSTVALTSADILALSTAPKEVVAAPATGASLEFQGATGQYTYGTTTYTGTGTLQVKCGTTVVSNDVPVTVLTGAVSGPVTFTALSPAPALVVDMPLTLTQTGGSLIGGDGTLSLDVTTSTHLPPDPPVADPAAVSPASAPKAATASTQSSKSTVGTSLYARKHS